MCQKLAKDNSFDSNNARMGESSDAFIARLADELQRDLAKINEFLPISLS
ncbi:hypothetical protein AO373_1951 [Moraxella catarrhalis]|nr:hypothetical protein AO379_0470 [Moraxella catarrhalis]OAV13136.1 hypothetical protein AO380_0266 [Moraxella catarrhalis]OAV17177.1 hypothetical protein AO373_1951 [Moraxella catarrhalis]OAV31425.1 hypothetical protein AO367_0705 [Moraxella catarrhalis]